MWSTDLGNQPIFVLKEERDRSATFPEIPLPIPSDIHIILSSPPIYIYPAISARPTMSQTSQDTGSLPSQAPSPAPSTKRVVHPPATAKNRSDLAETIEWFRKHQGGVAYKDNLILGLLLLNDDYGGLGFFQDRVLITRLVRQTDAKASQYSMMAKMAKKTLEEKAMIGLVISRDFQKLPTTFEGEEQFGVSGFWHLTRVFVVKSQGSTPSERHTDLMACLVYSGPKKDIWWTSKTDDAAEFPLTVLGDGETLDDRFESRTCPTCNQSSIAIFEEGWVCTNFDCSGLSKDASGALLQKPTYLKDFLEPLVSRQHLGRKPPRLLPDRSHQVQLTGDKAQNLIILRDHWRGWVCPDCHTMNRRKEYHRLVCACGHSTTSSPPHVRLDQVADDRFLTLAAKDAPPHQSINDTAVKVVHREFTKEFAIYTWELGPQARVMVLYPRLVTNALPHGNNDVFKKLQEKARTGAIPLARAGFSDDTSGRGFITRHFCANFGRQYNPSMKLTTVPFGRADALIIDLVQRAQAIVLERLGIAVEFNEALCLAYLPDMSIGWHNDGEVGLGDVIVSHSFGSNCEMKFAMKGMYWTGQKHNSGSKLVVTPDDPNLPGCLKGEERRALRAKLERGELTAEAYEAQLKEVVRGNKVSRDNVSPVLLRLVIPHGGYMIMHGENMQKYYQVSDIKPGGIPPLEPS